MDTSNKYFVMQNCLASYIEIPYQADMVNHAMNNETAKITDTLYQADIVNHTTKNKTADYGYSSWYGEPCHNSVAILFLP